LSYPVDGPEFPGPPSSLARFDVPLALPPRPRKFRARMWLHLVLFVVTLVTTTMAGALHYAAFLSEFNRQPIAFGPGAFLDPLWLLPGFWYSGTLLAILGAHEMGHYLLCRRHDVDATLPYFLPMPPLIFLTGTLGAVIKIREPFPNRKVLFDIGVAGPIAGFVLLVPALFYGMSISNILPVPTKGTVFSLGEPLLFRWAMQLVFGTIRDGYTVNMHPMVFAAWFGMLATALNLLPFGQLDGGHLTYAALGRPSVAISLVTVATCVVMTFFSSSWMFMTLMMLAMLFLLGPRHPRVIDEHEPLGAARVALTLFAIFMLVVCFTATPIEIQDLIGTGR
jgi:membrane-associated protease RseP (regulator of RpoE activity)